MTGPPILTTCTQGRSRIGCTSATGRVRFRSSRVWRASREATCLAVFADKRSSSARSDDGADVLTVERAGQIAGNEAIDDLHLVNVARRLQEVEHRELQNRVLQAL